MGMELFFEPGSVAIVGASRSPGKPGHDVVKNMLDMGYMGKIYPVNPEATEILGLKTYKSIGEIPDPVDLAVIVIPAALVTKAVEECIARGIKAVIIESMGFADIGGEGIEREKELVRICKETNTRIMGPNSIGVLNMANNLWTPFPAYVRPRKGPLAFFGQTGLFASELIYWMASSQYFGVSKIVCLGNECDVNETDILEYLGEDDETRVIVIYLEGIRGGRRFLEVARKVAKEKPIIVLKVGRTEIGARAAASHTGSIVGEDAVYDAAFRQLGIIRAREFDDLFDYAKAFAYQPLPQGPGLGVITITGAGGVIAADLCGEVGLLIPKLGEKTIAKARDVFPDWASIGNPLDIYPAVERNGMIAYKEAVASVMEDENVDSLLVLVLGMPGASELFRDIFKYVEERCPDKTLAVCVMGEKEASEELYRTLETMNIPTYPSVERAVRALAALYKYRCFLSKQ